MWVHRDGADRNNQRARTARLRGVLGDLVAFYLPAGAVISIDRTCGRCAGQHGKPRVVVDGRVSRLRLSVAHTSDVALFAFSGSAEVGIDVETVHPGFDWSLVLDDVFSEAEQRQTEATAPDLASRRQRHYERWVAKEAVLKAIGVGLAGPVKEVDTTGLPDATWNGWAVAALPLELPLVGALACGQRPGLVRLLTLPG